MHSSDIPNRYGNIERTRQHREHRGQHINPGGNHNRQRHPHTIVIPQHRNRRQPHDQKWQGTIRRSPTRENLPSPSSSKHQDINGATPRPGQYGHSNSTARPISNNGGGARRNKPRTGTTRKHQRANRACQRLFNTSKMEKWKNLNIQLTADTLKNRNRK